MTKLLANTDGTVSSRWDDRVDSWHEQVSHGPAFAEVRRAVLAAAAPLASDRCVDLGTGTGFLALALALAVAEVLAVDSSPRMLAALRVEADRVGVSGVTAVGVDLADLHLPPGSVDLVVSSYALHHLSNAEKRTLLARVQGWLRPGGRLVVADMMFGRGGSRRDRQILASKVRTLAAKGPAGAWRIARNVGRYALGTGPERPAAPAFFEQAAADAGFGVVRYVPIVAEAGLLTARR